MEAFDVDAAKLASLLSFCPYTLLVLAEFANKEDFLEKVKAEWGLEQYVDAEMPNIQVDMSEVRAGLVAILRE